MLEKLLSYFAEKHLLTNFIFAAVFVGGIFAWQKTAKEEMPAITFDTVRISVRYPGASAEDVEYFVTKPIEEEVRGLDGVYQIKSTSSVGVSNVSVELEPNYPLVDTAVTEIRNAVLDVQLPDEIIDDPEVRVFKTSKKAILDIALIHRDHHILSVEGRQELQQYALALENQLLNLPQVHSINKNGYLQEEIQIKIYPEKLLRYDIPFNTVMAEIRNNHLRKPAGTLEMENEPKVTLLSELNTPERLNNLIIQGGFEGQVIRLGEVADIGEGYEKVETIYKVNGHEAVMFSVVKNSTYGILVSLDAVEKLVKQFSKSNLEGTPIQAVLLDDESIDVRNRLRIISVNGGIGFILILFMLFLFLNKRSGFWVALGIPFTFCFTMMGCSLMGFTINGTTLAAVIIVMGIVVDDAIVVAENITRKMREGMEEKEATIKGTSQVFLPIVASIVTTCVAFVPLFFFEGRYGRFIAFIPPVIFFMLGASLLESVLILPGHMELHLPFLKRFKKKKEESGKGHWFDRIEDRYGAFLERVLPWKWLIFGGFIVLLLISGFIVTQKMKFVMFPHEETRDIVLSGETPPGTTRYETARMVRDIEDIVIPYIGKEAVGFRTEIARSRRGSAVEENKFRMIIEIVPREERRKSANQLVAEFEKKILGLKNFEELVFAKSRWGQESGSPVEIIIQQNNDEIRHKVVEEIVQRMQTNPVLKSIEPDEGLLVPEYRIDINREMIKRLAISPQDLSSTFRAALEGVILYEFSNGEEDVKVRFTTVDAAKDNIEKVLDLPVENRNDYLVPLKNIVTFEEVTSPNAIPRQDLKRTAMVYADIERGKRKTPLDIATYLEEEVFPSVLTKYPTTAISFGGEIKDTRESGQDFQNAIVMVLILIYMILAILFNSLVKPLIIMTAIPFGVVGVILAFYLHGKGLFGFYAAVGTLGLAGVVINNAIIMLVKLDGEFDPNRPHAESKKQISKIAQTRLRAVVLTTLTTVAGVMPTAYGFAGYDAMLAEMMLALAWGMIFGTLITLVLIPCIYNVEQDIRYKMRKQ